MTASPEGELFTELKNAAGAMSGGGGGGGNERHWDGHGNNIYTSMNVNNAQKGFRFMIRESTAPFQELVFEDHSGKGLRIQFSSVDRQLLFSKHQMESYGSPTHQKSDPRRFNMTRTKKWWSGSQNLLVISVRYSSSLESTSPLTNYDPHVVQTVGRLLLKPDPESVRKANEAITQLGADSYPGAEESQKN